MAEGDEAPQESSKEGSKGGVKNFVTKKVGPLPLWGWVAVGAGVLFLLKRRAAAAAAASGSTSTSPPAVGLGTVDTGGASGLDLSTSTGSGDPILDQFIQQLEAQQQAALNAPKSYDYSAIGPYANTIASLGYQSELGRAPDTSGLIYWEGEVQRRIAAGLSPQDAVNQVIGIIGQSPEASAYEGKLGAGNYTPPPVNSQGFTVPVWLGTPPPATLGGPPRMQPM